MNKLHYGIIGCGVFGEHHIMGIQELKDAEIVAICDVNVERCKVLAETYGIPKVYADYNELLRDNEIEAVAIVTSDQTHAEITVAALRAGKHVLCEKPMSLDLEECKKMIKASDESGKKLMIGQICRFTPGFLEAKKLVESGVIGELFFVESEYAHDYSHMTSPNNWRMAPERHPIIGGACHAIDLLRWIAGNPDETMAYGNHKVMDAWPVDDCTVAIFRFPNQVIGKVFCSIGCKRNYTMRTVLYGSRGTIIVDNKNPYIQIFRDRLSDEGAVLGGIWGKDDHKHILRKKIKLNDHNTMEENKQFITAVLNDTPVETDGREGARTVAVCKAVVESCATGLPVKIEYDF